MAARYAPPHRKETRVSHFVWVKRDFGPHGQVWWPSRKIDQIDEVFAAIKSDSCDVDYHHHTSSSMEVVQFIHGLPEDNFVRGVPATAVRAFDVYESWVHDHEDPQLPTMLGGLPNLVLESIAGFVGVAGTPTYLAKWHPRLVKEFVAFMKNNSWGLAGKATNRKAEEMLKVARVEKYSTDEHLALAALALEKQRKLFALTETVYARDQAREASELTILISQLSRRFKERYEVGIVLPSSEPTAKRQRGGSAS